MPSLFHLHLLVPANTSSPGSTPDSILFNAQQLLEAGSHASFNDRFNLLLICQENYEVHIITVNYKSSNHFWNNWKNSVLEKRTTFEIVYLLKNLENAKNPGKFECFNNTKIPLFWVYDTPCRGQDNCLETRIIQHHPCTWTEMAQKGRLQYAGKKDFKELTDFLKLNSEVYAEIFWNIWKIAGRIMEFYWFIKVTLLCVKHFDFPFATFHWNFVLCIFLGGIYSRICQPWMNSRNWFIQFHDNYRIMEMKLNIWSTDMPVSDRCDVSRELWCRLSLHCITNKFTDFHRSERFVDFEAQTIM